MITKIAHIGIAVKDIKTASEVYRKILRSEPSAPEIVSEQGVNVVKFKVGESVIELLEGTSSESPISRFIEKRGEGIHHISYESDDIHQEMGRLEKEGFKLLFEEPKTGAGNSLITFLHPANTNSVLTEISQHKSIA